MDNFEGSVKKKIENENAISVEIFFGTLQSSGSQPFFCSRNPYSVFKIFGGTPDLFNRNKDQGKVTIGGTLGTSSRHYSVPRHHGW